MANDAGVCPKCGSRDQIPRADVLAYGGEGGAHVNVKVNRHPHALLLKGTTTSPLWARVCGACGFTELYAKEPAELLSAYRDSQAEER